MDDDLDIHQFLELLQKRGKIPASPKARYLMLATELADGVTRGFWARIEMPNQLDPNSSFAQRSFIEHYFIERWNAKPPDFSFLQNSGYLVPDTDGYFIVTPVAVELLDKQRYSAIKVFISYSRQESSAFALLIHDRLKELGINVFLDMESLLFGDNWQEALEEGIQGCNYFILLIGQTTLGSKNVLQEIEWAYQYKRRIIPIWHNGFHYDSKWDNRVPPLLKPLLSDTHTLVIEKEDPSQYDFIMQRLFRYFEMG